MSIRTPPPAAERGAYKRRKSDAEEVRLKFARLLHDGVLQTLSAMLLDLDELRAAQQGQTLVLKRVDSLERTTRKALSELRDLARQLRTSRQGDRDVVKLVKRGIRDRIQGRPAVKFELTVSPGWPERIPGQTAEELHRIVEEAVENGIRHGGARRIGVAFTVTARARHGYVTVTDDGLGLPGGRGFQSSGLGIVGMRERAAILGGKIQLARGPEGRGTKVRVTVPLEALGQPA
jgi:signal transduction histidine kinase